MIFNQEQIDKIESVRSNLTKAKNLETTKMAKRDLLDGEIFKNPLISKNEVVDARSIIFAIDGAERWSSKQCGI